MPADVIHAARLTRRFGSVTALHAVDVHVSAGEAVAVLGPNGAGKSTLLRLVATLIRPTAGGLQLFGRPLPDGASAARRRLGFLSHESFLYPDLTPLENLEFYASLFGVPAPAERARAALQRVDLLGWAQRPVRTLSRGLQQRCALARTLVHAPELLLLDEPFTGLDVEARSLLVDILRDARGRGTTWLMTTHDLASVIDLCTRAVILTRGAVVYDAPIQRQPAAQFEQTYVAAVAGAATAA